MTVRKLFSALFFALVSFALSAQESTPTGTYRSFSPADQWELGVDLGLPFIVGDIDAKFPGIGAGLHVRKSLDHLFSLRFNGNYFSAKNEEGIRTSENTWLSGSGQVVVAVNNFRFNKPHRKLLINVFAGVGVNSYSTEFTNIQQTDGSTSGKIESSATGHLELGAGLAFRVGPRFNIGLEHTVYSVFGGRADLLDSDENVGRPVTTYRDLLQFPHLSLNFNLGGTDKKTGLKKSEPLYWANPMTQIGDAIAALEARPVYDPTDTDGDGIIDAIDQEINSPAGARVDTRGVTLDSDGDKVPDYKDKEPFSPPGFPVDADGVAQVPKYTTEPEVNRIVDAKIAAIKFPEPKTNDWFFPSVNFADNSYALRFSEYEKLYQVATVLKQNPNINVVAVGHTDRRGSERHNNVLSYNRAKAAIDFLVAQHGIDRNRVILNWAGESSPVVPVSSSSLANRRVEFRVAKGETEMARPEGPNAGTGGKMQGNKDAGY
ncbi:MAG: OmpA family protein [Saprospiraceae bacterium]|nr:OmpA family protein [Saprospiraceae bacterium]